jgi:hypothetical protein
MTKVTPLVTCGAEAGTFSRSAATPLSWRHRLRHSNGRYFFGVPEDRHQRRLLACAGDGAPSRQYKLSSFLGCPYKTGFRNELLRAATFQRSRYIINAEIFHEDCSAGESDSLRVAASLMAVSASCIIAFLLAVIGWPLVHYIQYVAN